MALPKPSALASPDDNLARIGAALDAVDANTAGLAQERQDRQSALAAEAQQRAGDMAGLATQVGTIAPRGLPSVLRPGDGARAFTLATSPVGLGGEADALPPLPASALSFASNGGVVLLPPGGVLASREATPIEPGRIRAVRASVMRLAGPSDPNGATVRIGVQLLDQAKQPLAGQQVVIADLNALTPASGRQTRIGYVAASPGANITLVAPPGAAYFRRFVQNFALDGVLAVDTLAATDITETLIPPPVTSDALARLTALESANAGPRIASLEQQAQAPNSLTFATRADAAAARVTGTVTTILTRGRAAYGDGRDGLYARISGSLPSGADGFTSQDGAVWQRVQMAQDVYEATFPPREAQWLQNLPTTKPATNGTWWNNGGIPTLRGASYPVIEFPVYDGGTIRNLVDRSRGVVNVADMPNGTTGSPADDDAALTAALDASKRGGLYYHKALVLDGGGGVGVRNWNVLTQHVLEEGSVLLGTAQDQTVLCPNPQAGSSVLLITGGRTEIANLRFASSMAGAFASYDAIQVSKAHDGIKKVHLHDLTMVGFRSAVRWQDGDCPRLVNIDTLNCVIAIAFMNDGTSGYLEDITAQGGGGLYYGVTNERLAASGSAGLLAAEGCHFVGLDLLAAVSTGIDGQPCRPPLDMQCGSYFKFASCVFSEVHQGNAANLDGSKGYAISKMNFDECSFLGSREAPNMVGLNINGAVTQTTISGGLIYGFTKQGVCVGGDPNAAYASPGNLFFERVPFGNNGDALDGGHCDLFAAYASAPIYLRGCSFGSSADRNSDGKGNPNNVSVYGVGSIFRGSDNFFILPWSIGNNNFNFDRSRGPGAHGSGLPVFDSGAAAIAAGLDSGCWFEGPNATIRRVGIGG